MSYKTNQEIRNLEARIATTADLGVYGHELYSKLGSLKDYYQRVVAEPTVLTHLQNYHRYRAEIVYLLDHHGDPELKRNAETAGRAASYGIELMQLSDDDLLAKCGRYQARHDTLCENRDYNYQAIIALEFLMSCTKTEMTRRGLEG